MEKKKVLVRVNPRMTLPEDFVEKSDLEAASQSERKTDREPDWKSPLAVKSLHNFMAGLQYDSITHFRREKYLPWPIAAESQCDSFVVSSGTALVLTCVRYKATSSYTIGGGAGKVTYYLQDEALMTYFLTNPPPARAIRTTINGVTIASQQFVYSDPIGPPILGDTIVDGYYTLNQNIIPPGYSMQTIAVEHQVVATSITNPLPMKLSIADNLEHFGVEYYGFTMPMSVWNRFKEEYAP